MSDDELLIVPYSKSKSDNPQQRLFEAIPPYRPKMKFVPGQGMVVDTDDISYAMQYDLNEAIADSEAETQRRKSFANVGYSTIKRRG